MRQNGNALFLILIAVALFAALSYAVTQSGRGGGNINREQAVIFSSQITQYGAQFEQAANRMKLLNGCSDTDFNFNYDSDGDGDVTNDTGDLYNNASSPNDLSCHIFQTSGGGINFEAPNPQWLDGANNAQPLYGELFFTGSTCIPGIGAGATGSCTSDINANEELLLIIPYITRTICEQLSENLGTNRPDGGIAIDITNAWDATPSRFEGIFNKTRELINNAAPDTSQSLSGKFTGCFEGGGLPASGTYHFYQVIIAR